MFSEFVHRNKGLLSIFVTLVLAVILVTQFGNRTANNEDAAVPVPSTAPTTTLITTSLATNATPVPPPQEGASVIATSKRNSFENRVLDFEEAYYLPDPQARIEALRPFASDKYLSSLTTEDSSIASDSAANIRVTIDRGSASINAEPFDETDSSLQEVSVALDLTTRRNGDVVTTLLVHHRTVWIKDADNSWRVYSDAP